MLNMVIQEALQLGSETVTAEEPDLASAIFLPEDDIDNSTDTDIGTNDADGLEDHEVFAAWSKEYKTAKGYLFSDPPNFDQASQILMTEAEQGNSLAMHDLARMFADGLGREPDANAAQLWYRRALSAQKTTPSAA